MARAGSTELEIATFTGHTVSDVKSIMDTFYLNRDPALCLSVVNKLEKGTKSANRSANQSLAVTAKDS